MQSLKLDKKKKELYLILSLEELKDYHRLVVSDLGDNPNPEKLDLSKRLAFLMWQLEEEE